jgi:hypothetical protein
VLDFGAVDRLPDGIPPFIGRLLRIIHDGTDFRYAEQELRQQGFVRPGIEIDLTVLQAFLAPLAEPSRGETFKFSRDWLRGEAMRVTDPRSANMSRRLNLPPSYVLINRVSTAGIGVLCQLECEGPFRAEVLKWIPGYHDADSGDVVPSGTATVGPRGAVDGTVNGVAHGTVSNPNQGSDDDRPYGPIGGTALAG